MTELQDGINRTISRTRHLCLDVPNGEIARMPPCNSMVTSKPQGHAAG